ncbi:MAG: LicD family protein [Alistipes sp.]|nr:LicD family protein [Candidatus Alistipes equi]
MEYPACRVLLTHMVKYSQNDLQQLHNVLYEILREIARVCDVLNIEYFIQGGSAIGAFFNHGIVPWDDDIDVGMTRKNYNRFLKEAPKILQDQFFLEWFESEKGTPFYFAKLKLNNTLFVEEPFKDLSIHHGIFVDIFPYDKIPDSPVLERLHRNLSRFWINCFIGKTIWMWRWAAQCKIETPLPKSKVNCYIQRFVSSLLSKRAIYHITNLTLGMFNWCNTKRVNIVRMPKDQFFIYQIENREKVEFGPLMVYLPSDIEKYLRHHYPNLRPVLPVEEQINHAPYRLEFESKESHA